MAIIPPAQPQAGNLWQSMTFRITLAYAAAVTAAYFLNGGLPSPERIINNARQPTSICQVLNSAELTAGPGTAGAGRPDALGVFYNLKCADRENQVAIFNEPLSDVNVALRKGSSYRFNIGPDGRLESLARHPSIDIKDFTDYGRKQAQ